MQQVFKNYLNSIYVDSQNGRIIYFKKNNISNKDFLTYICSQHVITKEVLSILLKNDEIPISNYYPEYNTLIFHKNLNYKHSIKGKLTNLSNYYQKSTIPLTIIYIYLNEGFIVEPLYFVIIKYAVKKIRKIINDYIILRIILTKHKLIINNNDIVEHKDIFTSSKFQDLLNKQIDDKEYEWSLVTQTIQDVDTKYNNITNNLNFLDIETYSIHKNNDPSINYQEIYSIGLMKLSNKDKDYIIKNKISLESLFFYQQKKVLFEDNQKHKDFFQQVQYKFKILYFYQKTSSEIQQLLYDVLTFLKSSVSRTFCYTFNGKNFDHHILIKYFTKYLTGINICKIILVKNAYYSFEFVYPNVLKRSQLERYLQYTKKCKTIEEVKLVYTDKQIKFYELLRIKPKYLDTTIIFRDITTLIPPSSLKKLCHTILPIDEQLYSKQDFDIVAFMVKLNQNQATLKDKILCDIYLLYDLFSTLLVSFNLFYVFIYKFKLNPLAYFTASSISLARFKQYLSQTLKNQKIFLTTNNFITKIIQASVVGGRVLCLKPLFNITLTSEHKNRILNNISDPQIHNWCDEIIQTINSVNLNTQSPKSMIRLDVNSLYPCSMAYFLYPLGPKQFLPIDISNYLNLIQNPNNIFICYCKLQTPLTHRFLAYPQRILDSQYKKSYKWKEYIEGIMLSTDILNLTKLGYVVIELQGGILWTSTDKIFYEYISDLYTQRLHGSKTEQYINKLLMNSLYGKFLQKAFGQQTVIEQTKAIIGLEKEYAENLNTRIYALNNNYVLIQIESNNKTYYPTVFGSLILSYSRRIMDQIFLKLNAYQEDVIYYSDTDSIDIASNNMPLVASLLEHHKEIGLLKCEQLIDKAIFLGNKMYSIVDKDGQTKTSFKGFTNMCVDDLLVILLGKLTVDKMLTYTSNRYYEKILNLIEQNLSFTHNIFKKDLIEGIYIQELLKKQNSIGPALGQLCLRTNQYLLH